MATDDPRSDQPADDALERESVVAAPAAGDAPAKSGRGGPIGFLQASWSELKRVQWPDRRQVGQGTAVVIGFVIIAGGYLGLLDAVWQPLVNAII